MTMTSAVQAADNAAAFSMSIEEFRSISDADQKALLTSVFEHRLEHAANIHYEALQLIDLAEYDAAAQKIGKVVERLNGSRLEQWVLGKSYRMDTIRGGPDAAKRELSVASGFDVDSGLARSTVHRGAEDRAYGRIDTKPDQINESNFYARWLDGELVRDNDSLFRYLVEYRDEFKIEASEGQSMVRLTVPWHFWGEKEPWGARVFSLDPQKGFLPVHGRSRGESNERGDTDWRLDEFFVEESRLVGDAWMPTKLKWVIHSSSVKGTCSVKYITIGNIEAGKVTTEDLEVPFEPEMLVVDAVKGESFVVGSDGERTKVRSLVGGGAAVPPPKRTGNRLLWLGLGNLLIVVAAVFLRQFIRRGGSRAIRT